MSMDSVAARIWNEIARTQPLRTQWARERFSMNEDQITAQINKDYAAMTSKGMSKTVAAAFLDVFPFLVERNAIMEFLETRPDLSTALLEINSINEAVIVASQDHLMNPLQQRQLQKALREALPGPND